MESFSDYNYQGQVLTAETVNSVDGNIHLAAWGEVQGSEMLLRDRQGNYYLYRLLTLLWIHTPRARHARRQARIHRLSVLGAIQWAAERSANTPDLRRDATAACRQGAAMLFQDADAVTVPLTLPSDLYQQILAMGAYDERADLSATIVHSMEGDVQSWLDTPDTNPSPQEFLEQYLEAHPLPPQADQLPSLQAAARYAAKHGRTLHEFIADALALAAQNAAPGGNGTADRSSLRTKIGIGRGLLADVREHARQRNESEEEALADLLRLGLYAKHCGHRLVELDHVALPLARRYGREHGVETEDLINGIVVNWLEAMLQIREGRT